MNSDRPTLSTLVSLVMVLATATLGWIAFTPRPLPPVADHRTFAQPPAPGQNVVARLWEDPLQAVHGELSKSGERRSPPRSLDQMKKDAKEKKKKICLLVVPVPETPFPGDAEARLRTRYSVQTALAKQKYAPEDRDHLGYFNFPARTTGGESASPAPKATLDDPRRIPGLARTALGLVDRSPARESAAEGGVEVPYEWFNPRVPAGGAAVLVLWLPEGLLRTQPLRVLADLRNRLAPEQDDQVAGIFLIGPRSSDTLLRMVPDRTGMDDNEAASLFGFHECVCPPEPSLFKKFCVFSPQATTPDPLLGLEARARRDEARKDLEKRLHRAIEGVGLDNSPGAGWRYFRNFVAPDDQLTDLLVNELNLREVDLDKGTKDRILVLAEADTSYGRSLPDALEASLQNFRILPKDGFNSSWESGTSGTPSIIGKMATGTSSKGTKESPVIGKMATGTSSKGTEDSPFFVYRYLRGLDQQKGQQGNEKASNRQAGKSPEEALADLLTRTGAMPLGESQLDYVDRLADDLKNEGEIKAVGVLGGDIYDKLILMRALRPRFPGAVFFTTDLDARLWHPDHLPFTRNLIVASAYGVNAADFPIGQEHDSAGKESDRIPSFRVRHQVAVFRACRAALEQANVEPSETDAATSQKTDAATPQIYELGLKGPIKLSAPQAPTVNSEAGRLGLHLLLSMMMAGIAMSLLVWPAIAGARTAGWIESKYARAGAWVAVTLISMVVFYWLVPLDAFDPIVAGWKEMRNPWPETPDRRKGLRMLLFGMLAAPIMWAIRDWSKNWKSDEIRVLHLLRRNLREAGAVIVAVLLVLAFYSFTRSAASQLDGEPWEWCEGISIWPTELVRLIIILTVAISLIWAREHHRLSRESLTAEFFREDDQSTNCGKEPPDSALPLQQPGLNMEVSPQVGLPVQQPKAKPFPSPNSAKAMLDAYLKRAEWGGLWGRAVRVTVATGVYMALGFGLMFLVEGHMPYRPNVRGTLAQNLDLGMLLTSIICFLWLLFYVLDAVGISAELLRKVSNKDETEWPEQLTARPATKFCVNVRDVSGYLDVMFAAKKSRPSGMLIFLPFIVQFLFIVSRNSYFDNWSWPGPLICIFVCNLILAGAGWWIMRDVAKEIRKNAEEQLKKSLDAVARAEKTSNNHARKQGLMEMQRLIKNERRGAYSRIIQDPALIAMLLPTGILGILMVLIRAIFGAM